MTTRASNSHSTTSASHRRRVLGGGVLIGLGIGGFFDGIVLHQILQWHHMVSNRYPVDTVAGLEINTFGDGVFHAATYAFVVVGLFLLWSAARRRHEAWPTRILVGTLLLGWGLFNLAEGIVVHHLLGVHHVRPGPNQLAWDLGFLAWGATMLAIGWALVRHGLARMAERSDEG